jgi:hypothetical protein
MSGAFGAKAASSSAFPGRGRPRGSRYLRMSSPFRSRRLTLTSWRTFIGLSGFAVRWAGQTELQRPHSVHAYESRRLFHGSSCTRSIPNFSVFSKSICGGSP